MDEIEFRSFLADTLGACAKVLRDGAVHFVWAWATQAALSRPNFRTPPTFCIQASACISARAG